MSEQYDKNKEFLFSNDCRPTTPLASEFVKNCRLFMANQSDFTEDHSRKYFDKLQSDIDVAKSKQDKSS